MRGAQLDGGLLLFASSNLLLLLFHVNSGQDQRERELLPLQDSSGPGKTVF